MRLLPRLLPASLTLPIARALSLFLALFTLLNLLGALRSPGFDANYWWIDLGYLPRFASHTALLLAALALLAFGIGFPRHFLVTTLLRIASVTLTAAVFWNVATFYFFWAIGRIHPGVPIPFSLLLSFTLAFIFRASFLPWKFTSTPQRALFLSTFLAAFLLFPLAQMYCFGKTDYRRPVDAIVVFGARAYADGKPSQALADRLTTAAQLYKEGLAPLLILSGGPGDGPTSEPQSMRTLALSLGIPDSALLLDEQGLTTDATINNTKALAQQHHLTTLIAVSHFYHLPRVRMTFTRAFHTDKGQSVKVYTVPATEPVPLSSLPKFMAREIAALWAYYLRPLYQTP